MQFRRRSRKRVVINITSLIDILFLLIIFFVVTSTFLEQPGMRLDLPTAESAESQSVEELVIDLEQNGRIVLDGEDVDLGGLLPELAERVAAEGSGRVLVIRADRNVPHGRVVKVMDAARQAGVKDLVIATEIGGGDE
jgi:biopolymer transport protein ExbD